jgi:hypothetical protein
VPPIPPATSSHRKDGARVDPPPRPGQYRPRPVASGTEICSGTAHMGGNMVRARLPGMASERAIWADETIGRRSSLPGNWPEGGHAASGAGDRLWSASSTTGGCTGSVSASAERSSAAPGDQGAGQRCGLAPGGSCTVVPAGHLPGSRELSWAGQVARGRREVSRRRPAAASLGAACSGLCVRAWRAVRASASRWAWLRSSAARAVARR